MAKKIVAQEACMFCLANPCECDKPEKKKEAKSEAESAT